MFNSMSIRQIDIDSINNYQIISPLQVKALDIHRVIAIGDIHGYYSQFIDIMAEANICDDEGKWIANNTILVQTGDVFDRKPNSFKVLRALISWHQIAPMYGSLCLMIMGNHEAMHIDRRYFPLSFAREHGMHPSEVELYGGIDHIRKYWLNTHSYGRFLKHLPIARVIGNALFVHAGLLPGIAAAINGDIEFLNNVSLRYFQHGEDVDNYLQMMESCYWTREFDDMSQSDRICEQVKASLSIISYQVGYKVNMMVVGHSTKSEITHLDCNGTQLWYIDAGIWLGRAGYWTQHWDHFGFGEDTTHRFGVRSF